jgi:uncharacterized membrane protein
MTNEIEKSTACSTGLSPAVSVLLIYLFGWISGLIFLFIEKNDRMVRFHAMQSTVMSIGFTGLYVVVTALSIVPFIGFVLSLVMMLLSVGYLVVIILIIVKKFNDQDVKLPLVGDLAEKLLRSV